MGVCVVKSGEGREVYDASLRVSSTKYVSSEADSLIQNNCSTQALKPATCGLGEVNQR